MKRALRILSLALLAAAGLFWLAAGSNLSWTKTSVPVKTLDEVTGIEGISYERRLVPGIDFLAAGALGAAVLGGLSFLFRNNKNQQANNPAT